jgi:pilus assembly protein TadC
LSIPFPKEESELKFHENARALAVQTMRGYGERLLRESVSAARARSHPIVLKKDVQYASQLLRSSGRNRKNVFFQFLGAGLLGVFLQGFTAEMLSAEPEPWTAVVYVVIGFAGIFGVFWSLIR